MPYIHDSHEFLSFPYLFSYIFDFLTEVTITRVRTKRVLPETYQQASTVHLKSRNQNLPMKIKKQDTKNRNLNQERNQEFSGLNPWLSNQ